MIDTAAIRQQAIDHAVADCDGKSTARHAAHVASDRWENEIDLLLITIERLKDCLRSVGVSDALVEAIASDQPSSAEALLHEYRKEQAKADTEPADDEHCQHHWVDRDFPLDYTVTRFCLHCSEVREFMLGGDDPLCAACNWEESHLRHHVDYLYNYHVFVPKT